MARAEHKNAAQQAVTRAEELEKEVATLKEQRAALDTENHRLTLLFEEAETRLVQTETLLQSVWQKLNPDIEPKTLTPEKATEIFDTYLQDRQWVENELKTRMGQQAVVVELGQHVLAGLDLPILMDKLVKLATQALQVEFCQIFELLPNEDTLILRASIGGPADVVGRVTMSASPETQIGHTLLSSEPLIIEDLTADTRFSSPPFLRGQGVVSSISVIIDSRDWPHGVLSVHTTQPRTFTRYDVDFLQSIANLLAQAIERHRTEAALRESEEKYRTLIEQSSDAIFLIYGGRFEVINPRFEEIFGVTQEDTLAPDFVFTNIIAPKSKNIINQLIGRKREPKTRAYYEFTALDKDGHEIEVELTVSYPTFKGGLATQGIIRDITERKRVEAEKQRAYEQIQQYTSQLAHKVEEEQRQRRIATILAEVVASASLTLSTDELLDHILVKLRQLIPYDSAAIFLVEAGFLVMEAAHGFEAELVNQKYNQNILFQEMQQHKNTILVNDTHQDERYQFWAGAEKVRCWIGAPLLVAQEVIGYLTVDRYTPGAFSKDDAGVVQAFAHQVAQTINNAQLFAQLQATQKQLIQNERLAALGQMAATVAHELRNPLMAIRMGVEYFVHGLAADDPRQRGATLMQSNMARIDRIVEDILYIGRAPTPDFTLGSLHSVIESELAQWRTNLAEKDITAQIDLDTSLSPILMDSDQMGRAISNLIGNSVDAMGPGGQITVQLCTENESQIIILADNGPGISAKQQEKIFEPFFTTKTRGTGLGLSIVKQIIDAHHGQIEVWSEIGAGTKFTITLPQTQET